MDTSTFYGCWFFKGIGDKFMDLGRFMDLGVSSELEALHGMDKFFIGQVGLLRDLAGLFHRIQNGL